ncbi:hypothetical protein VNO80_21858 [Phaseolus coccineus]|uniref:Uncharacterized protein n=1 Tax=Phaseolus coccineus TaxID=3886 RepID=A0AAN9QY45_PHACN
MSLTIPTNLSKPAALRPKLGPKLRPAIVCTATPNNSDNNNTTTSSDLKAFSAALALSSILLSAPLPAVADIAVDKEAGVVAEVLRAGQRPRPGDKGVGGEDEAAVRQLREAGASVRRRRAAAPDRERRPEALGRVHHSWDPLSVHRRVDRVGGSELPYCHQG